MTVVSLDARRALAVNRRQIDGWLWRARYQLRRGEVARACEAMLSALWLMGVDDLRPFNDTSRKPRRRWPPK